MRAIATEVHHFEFGFFPLRQAIIYVHFPDSIVSSESIWKTLIKLIVFISSIFWSRLIGSRIVWEVNNLQSHERRYPFAENILMKVFVHSVSGVIHLSKTSIRESIELYPVLKTKPSTIMPHLNFHHLYPNRGEPERGRKILGVEKDKSVLMAFGLIRRYKGTKELVELFKKIQGDALRLVVVGKPADEAYVKELKAVAQSDPRVHLIVREILEQELPDIFAAVTLNCATFRAILNSGSVMLALSFGCPVVAPSLGSLRDLQEVIGADWVSLYDGELTVERLSEAISWACKDRAGLPDLRYCDIDKITSDTFAFFEKISTI